MESDDEAELLLMTTLEHEEPTIIKKRSPRDVVRRKAEDFSRVATKIYLIPS